MTEYTPGPWMMTCGYVREIDGCHDLSVFITKGRFIAEVAYNDPEQEANARLIAAAPDLLAACEAALELFTEQIRITCGCGFAVPENDDDVMRQLRAAIAKARGGEA